MLSITALKDIISLNKTKASTEISIITKQTFKVALRALNIILYNAILHEIILRIQNNIYIIIAQTFIEIIQVVLSFSLYASPRTDDK